MSETHESLVGQVIASQFRILRKLGSGGMGAVFLAEQIEMDRKVVVKVLHPELTVGNPVATERFRREAKAVAQLNHPNIVQVFVFGQAEGGQMYLAMEYIEGRDLAHELAEGPMAQPRALRILDQCCAALTEAHGAGIVHRDLKPENIMLADRHGNPDYVKVLDFGIAKLHDGGAGHNPTLTQAGSVFGTPRYMSPEQVKGEPVDARSDLYALGIILYEMLVGRHPFVATTTIDYLMKHVSAPVPAPSAEGLEIQPRIEALLLKCLEKDPADRFQSAAELQREVRVCLRDFSEAARGFPSSQHAVPAPLPRAAPGTQPPGRDTYEPPGSRPRAGKQGVPAWVWGLVGLLLVGGVIGVVIAVKPAGGGGAALLGGELAGKTSGGSGAPEQEPVKEPVGADPDEEPDARIAAEGADGEKAAGAPDGEKAAGAPDAAAAGAPDQGPAPTTEVAAASESVEGFPLPADAKLVTSAAQTEMFETAVAPRDIVGFYKAKLHGRYTLSEVPNGLMIAEKDSPFSYIILSPNGDRFYLMFQRNVMAPRPEKPAGPPPPAFGVEFPVDGSLIMRSEQATVMRSRLGFKAVCDFYQDKYGALKGITVMRDDQAAQPYCTIAAAMAEGTPWMAISVVNDSTSAGAVMISVVPRQ